MKVYNLISLIIVVTAVFSYINYRFIKLPAAIGIMLISLVVSLLVIATGAVHPALFTEVTHVISTIDFNTVLMRVMLGFLLFAGAIHIDVRKLKKEAAAVITFSTIGVVLSAFIIAALLFATAGLFRLNIDFISCLLFGALISPTDPIAVMGILKQAKIPSSLEVKITGESLFNDGVAVVVFATIYEVMKVGVTNVSFGQIAWLSLKEAGGGLLYGLLLGYAGFWATRSVNNYTVEILITLAMVMGGYALAGYLQISGPLAMVAAGIITGNKSIEEGMTRTSKDYVEKFWEMIDEVMNAILFLLIGFEMVIIPFNKTLLWLGCITIVIVMLARLVSVAVPVAMLWHRKTFERNAISILTWGGLRGGISVAMALSLPENTTNEVFVSITYIVVLFSIVVQGLTIGRLARRLAV